MTTRRNPAPKTSPIGLIETIYRSNYPTDDPQPAERFAALAKLRELLDYEEQQIAFGMRLDRRSWQEIADAAGLNSRQAAQQRYSAARTLDRLAERNGGTPTD